MDNKEIRNGSGSRLGFRGVIMTDSLEAKAVVAEAAQPDPYAYRTFNDFFTRALKPGARPIAIEPEIVVSPVGSIALGSSSSRSAPSSPSRT